MKNGPQCMNEQPEKVEVQRKKEATGQEEKMPQRAVFKKSENRSRIVGKGKRRKRSTESEAITQRG